MTTGLSCAGTLAADDGSFPTADQVGGEVFPEGLKHGAVFPADIKLVNEKGEEQTLGDVLNGKRTLLVFFISAAPASVEELGKIDKFAADNKGDTQIIFANADTVGVALLGGGSVAIPETVRTINLIKQEKALTQPMFVAPNNVFDANGLSNRLGFRGLPTSYLIAADGKVEKQYVGTREWKPGDI
ncbi:TlpA family protein disulfide reductase [Pseudaminobacter arsenicus]|uniref:TlpA family protein disulfide reductase n=1 Tax=Borborobacter arsenicus TaxID=1851146 RepID=A0A432UZQ3_9HYPH|nr:TlpA family protein disulfide reductase [Pseudaminobacter arsenicus]RUM95403.1 TlpA family protein disulfide reductase [Pseudaminobacter arsenicus]